MTEQQAERFPEELHLRSLLEECLEACEAALPLHEAAADALADSYGDIHREMVMRLRAVIEKAKACR